MSDSLYPCVVQPIRGNLAPPPPKPTLAQPKLQSHVRLLVTSAISGGCRRATTG